MEPNKKYLFSRKSKRENSFIKFKDLKKFSIQKLAPSKLIKVKHMISVYSDISSPFNRRTPVSISPLPKLKSNNPRAKSTNLDKSFKKYLESKDKKASKKVSIRYLKQDFDEVEVINTIRTPDESMKATKNIISEKWTIPDFEEIFSISRVKQTPTLSKL